MFLHKNNNNLDNLRRVRGQCAGVPMADEGRQERLEGFQIGGRGNLRYACPQSVEAVWTELRKTSGCLRGRTCVRIPSQAHSGTKKQNGNPGLRFLKEQIYRQDHWARAEHLETDGLEQE